jgi:energy-coupling factor transport system substrate-specific component
MMTPSTSLTHPSSPLASSRWHLKDLVLVVVLGVVFGFVYWAVVLAWKALSIAMGVAGDLAQHVLFGLWLVVAPLAAAIVRRPGAGILAELIAAVVEVVFLGSPVGPLLLLAGFLQGLGSELPFLITRFRSFGWVTFALSGLLGAGLVFFWSGFRFGWYGQTIFFGRLGLQAVSGIILGGLLAKLLVDLLARTGVVDNYAIGRDRLAAGVA